MKNKKKDKSDLLSNIEKGVQNKLISFNADKTQIIYHVKEPYIISFENPEELVRAAYFCELVLNYQYPPDRIQLEVPIKPDKDRIDILVYNDNELKEPYIVVECKKDEISDAEFEKAVEQVFRYANYKKAWFAVAVTGTNIVRFNVKDFISGERKNNVISDIPIRYGKPPKYKYYKKSGKNLKIVTREELIKALKKCHDRIWQGGKREPTIAFDEMSKLLFCKLKDEKATTKNKAYQFQIGTNESPAEIFKRIEAIYKKAKQEHEDTFNEDLRVSPELVFSCLKHLQELAINNIDVDTKGIAFETFMKKDFFKGRMGQYFTPRNVARFAVNMMQPDSGMRVLDPACGSGGFMLNAIDYVRTYAEQNYLDKLEIYNHWHNFAKDRIFSIEINDQLASIYKKNMILQDVGHTNLINTDSLQNIDRLQSFNKRFQKNYFDLILTNPPFGARVSDKECLKRYALGKNKNKVRSSQKKDVLFIERSIEFLKLGTGKMAMVLHDGILNNSSLQYVRDYIMETCQVLAVVSLPHYAFRPYGTGVKTSLLFVRKKCKHEKLENYPIFMAIAEHIGYDATGRETPEKNDLDRILKQYINFEQTQNVSSDNKIFLINRSEIEGRMDPHYYKPEFINLNRKIRDIPNKQLGELINFSSETWNQKDFFTDKFPYIEIGDIDLKTGDIKNISMKKTNISDVPSSAKMVVRENDIIISRTRPSRGAISLIDKRFDGFIASTGFAVVRKIKVGYLDRKYLFYALRFDSTLKQFERYSSGGNYPTITKEGLQKALIPLPPKEIQTRILPLMNRAFALQREKKAEAERLLGSIDGYVLEQLGIKLPEIKQEKIFTVNVEDIKRFDVEYNQFKFEFLNQLENPIMLNKFIVDYKKGIEVGSREYVSEGIPFVRVSDIDDLNLKRTDKKISESLFEELKENFSPKKGELLYTKNGTIGLSYLVSKEENFIVSGAILRLICENIELAKFLKVIFSLKVYKEIVNKKSSGAVIKNLNVKEFLNIPIPVPDKAKRDKIISEVDEIKAKVQNLKKEATHAVEKAKGEVEDILAILQ